MNNTSNSLPVRINIATALNSKYMRYTYVMLTSLFTNQTDADIHVYLLHSDLSPQDIAYLQELEDKYHHINFLPVKREDFSASLPTTAAWTLETYYRLMLPDILPHEVDRLLYLDVDMIIDKPIKTLYETDFEDYYFCVCRDMGFINGPTTIPFPDGRSELFKEHLSHNFTYFNAGMMLWNIKKVREKYNFQTYMELARALNYKLVAPDQDLLNYLHWNQVKFLDEYRYDLFSKMAYNSGVHYEDIKRETTIIHFAGMKPWEGQYIHYDIEQLWWDYAKLTPFYTELMEEFMHACINDPTVPDTMWHLSEDKKTLRNELDKTSAMCQKLLQLLQK